MASDPSLKEYASSQDVATSKWTIQKSGQQVVAHVAWSVNFTLNRPAGDVWRYMKDFNLWMEDLHYNCVVGDAAEGSSIYFTISEDFYEHYRKIYSFDPQGHKKNLIVRRNEPGKLIVWEELSADGQRIMSYYVWALTEHEGKTTVTGVMTFAPYWDSQSNERELRARYQAMADEAAARWKTAYIP